MNIQINKYLLITFLTGMMAVIANCKGNSAGGSSKTSADGSTTTAIISSTSGGYINLQNMRLIIPQGALEQDTQITASFTNTSATAAGVVTLGQAIKLEPEGLQFLTPVQLELCYTGSEVVIKNVVEPSAMVYYADPSGQLIAMGGNVNTAGHCVTSSLEHFSTYISGAQPYVAGNTKPVIGGFNLLPASPLIGLPLRIRTTINDFNQTIPTIVRGSIVSAFLNYRIVGAPAFTRISLQPDTTDSTVVNRYYATIPAASVTAAGIEYYFEATDNLNMTNTTAPQVINITKIPTAIRFNPAAALDISNGFSRDFTLQANSGGWINISKDAAVISITGGIGAFSHTGPSKVTFTATTPGLGSLDAAVAGFNTSVPVTVQPGLLTSIEILDGNRVIIKTPVNIAVNGTFQFDAVGYDFSGNTAPIYPTFTLTGGVGTINPATALFSAASTAPLSGTLTATIAGFTDMVNINVHTQPYVVSTTPADGSKDNQANTTFSVTFSEAMDTNTLIGSITSACMGSIQVSNDNFATCVAMTATAPVFSAGNTVATLTPAANLNVSTYKVRVTTAAQSINTIPIAGVYTSTTGASVSGWAWMSGSNTVNAVGVYGTKGVASASNTPGSRELASTWSDSSGHLYLFGGYGYGSTTTKSYLNDLWQYDNNPASATYGQWTWLSGSNTVNAVGVYGTKGVASPTNVPGARFLPSTWSDSLGNLYLYGGCSGGNLSDLWKYDNDPASATYGQWTWVSGSSTINAAGVYGTKGVFSATNVPGARQFQATWSDSSGNMYLFGGINPTGYLNDLWKYDNNPASPTYGQWVWISGSSSPNAFGVYGIRDVASVDNMPGARHLAATWNDSLGNLYLFGGHGYGITNAGYLNDLWKYDNNPASATYGQWSWISGSSTANTLGAYGGKGVTLTTNIPNSRRGVSWGNLTGKLYLFGGDPGYLNDLWVYDNIPLSTTYGRWTWISGSNTGNAVGMYGTKGVLSINNVPGGRYLSATWSDSSGNLYLFGGANGVANFNDLWKYQP